MSYLFIDSSYDLSLGILDDDFHALTFERHSGQKASVILQTRVHELLEKNNLKPTDLKAVITVNGPGFYTGLRLSEGFSDVLHFFGVPNYSLYSYEIPFLAGHKSGVWFTKAYRGEYFFYTWNENQSEQKLVSAKDLASHLKDVSKVFIHSGASLDDLAQSLIVSSESTLQLLQVHPENILKIVVEKKYKRESYYFRAPEDEFKVNP